MVSVLSLLSSPLIENEFFIFISTRTRGENSSTNVADETSVLDSKSPAALVVFGLVTSNCKLFVKLETV